MNRDGANETDVREEIAAPLLAALGYRRGTNNDIAREMPLSYAREFLGRKKNTDPPLRGRADYVLTVAGAGRWVLEVKAPDEPIDTDAIEQAISYARHPEVSATYVVILNGVRLTLHHSSQRSNEKPLIDSTVVDVAELAARLAGVLSPAAIRRDCCPATVDLDLPLALGLRSYAAIRGGKIRHSEFNWSSNIQLPVQQVAHFDELGRRLKGFLVSVTGGDVRRDKSSRIRARLTWAMPHDELLRFALDKRLMDVEYIALAKQISADIENPTVFDVVGEVKVDEGETVFDMMHWSTETAGVAMHMLYQGQATDFISESVFKGVYDARYECSFPSVPLLKINMNVRGDFRVEIDSR